ncbi:MAG: biosynthetic-type acetolactate synthase large subunit [Bacteroidales bacterium]
MKGSQAIIQALLEEGVDTIFGYPGGAIMPVYDAIYDYSAEINHVLTRHEQGAAHAAQGYARVSGKTGVCFVTSGPGATNLVTGIADAMIDSTPLVCISGQVASPLLGTDAFQESDVIGITMPITKWNYQITDVNEIPWVLAKAFYIASSGRPGPVLIDIAKDVQFAEIDFKYEKCTSIRSYIRDYHIDEDKITEAAELINKSQKPLLLLGHGVLIANAEKELLDLVEKGGIPTAWTLLGLSIMPTNHPLNMGMLGMHGNYAPNVLTNQADLIIAVGMRFDDRVTGTLDTYAKQAKIIHLELDPAEINKLVKADVAIIGNAKRSLAKLCQAIEQCNHNEWAQEFKRLHDIEMEKVINLDVNPIKGGLTMAEVIRRASEASKGDAIVVTDVGQQQMMAARYSIFNRSRSFVSSGGLGTMGFGLPAAVGAKIGAPDRPVVLIVGDGGFQMTIQELGTIAQEELDIKIIILNNRFLGMVRQWQELFFDKRYSFTSLKNPNFVGVANAYGINANSVDNRKNLQESIDKMFSTKGPYVLEVLVEKGDNVFPMIPNGYSVSDILLEPLSQND